VNDPTDKLPVTPYDTNTCAVGPRNNSPEAETIELELEAADEASFVALLDEADEIELDMDVLLLLLPGISESACNSVPLK
jgi:hypothetical protein